MKFAEELFKHLTPEWRSQYIQYEKMKEYLYEAHELAPSIEETNEEILQRHFTKNDEKFFLLCEDELNKVDAFFATKLAEAIRRFHELELEVAHVGFRKEEKLLYAFGPRNQKKQGNAKVLAKKNLKELKFAIREFYLSLVLIQNFQQLNFQGFRKILKKHDKIFRSTSGVQYRQEKVENSSFYVNRQIDKLITHTEVIAIDDLYAGDRAKAMGKLRVPPLADRVNYSTPSFLWGLYTGVFLVLIIAVFLSTYFKGKDLRWEPALRMYRGMFLIFYLIGLLGLNVHGWNRSGVNHVLIFELELRDSLTFVDLLKISAFLGVIWSSSCLAFLFSKDFHIPIFAHPLACGVFFLAYFLNPTRTLHFRARRWLLRILGRILLAPFRAVRFSDFWLADQLNSLVVSFRDFQYFLCFYSYDWYNEGNEMCLDPRNAARPFVALLPAWWRFAQCLRRYHDTKKAFPHLVNAGKYTTSMLVTLISTVRTVYPNSEALRVLWICSLIVGTFYTLFWDIKMDWGLFAKNAGANRFLREQIVYDRKVYYYLAVLADLIFRFLWTLTVSIDNSGLFHHEFFIFFIAVCEVTRRFIWNFFRLENEHLNNVGEFRAVRHISIKPATLEREDNTKKQNMMLEQLMDSEEGPIPQKKAIKYILNTSSSLTISNPNATTANGDSGGGPPKNKLSSMLKIV